MREKRSVTRVIGKVYWWSGLCQLMRSGETVAGDDETRREGPSENECEW